MEYPLKSGKNVNIFIPRGKVKILVVFWRNRGSDIT